MSSLPNLPFRPAGKAGRHRRERSRGARRAAALLPVTSVAVAAVVVAAAGHDASADASDATAASATPVSAEVAAAPTTSAASAIAAATAEARTSVSRSFDRTAPRHRAHKRHAEHAKHSRHAKHSPHPHHPRHRASSQPPFAPSNAARTVASAKSSDYNVPGLCLQWSREQADIPSKYPTAAVAWTHASGRHPRSMNPPRGAAVYWTGGSSGAGHIAISVGHHKVRSSDAGGSGQVATVPIRRLTAEWHLHYAGWANSINGYTIPGVLAG